ncbi:P22 coat protein-gene protein 5 [Kaistia soli DSM 19436]|uniref:p22 coat protein-gene protein 5 n=1 Tax=Kaistia soli DSM 19436 TaxID=1122133 RepID=A0A1M5MQ64_9HYPH|nr:P22 phage major capsid protein family protein [Kaistia soli]SHG79540.1 P22 coat protein-gene protein 5 [Kaistia soli DSM 19436]
MANTITAVLPSIFAGLDLVSRELIGAIPAVQRDATMERAAVGQTVTVPVVPAATGGNITPASVPPDDGDATIGSKTVAISKSKYSPVRWNGEEQRAIGPGGQYNKILGDQFAQAFRWLANQVEVDLVTTAYRAASRAYGTAGTAPFGTAGDFTDFAGINQILDTNGAPQFGRHLIVGSAARFNLEGKQSVLFKANEANTDEFLRRRVLTEVMGFGLGYSAGVGLVTKGGGSGYLVNNGAGYSVGSTAIAVDTGSGTINAGDIVTFAGDSNKYVVASATPTLLTLNAPGLLSAAADNTAITVGNNFTDNVAFTENALVLAARAPAAPDGGDSAEDMQMVTDPVSGISFEIRLYREYRRMRYEVGLAWGVGIVKSEHIALLLG